MPTLKPGDVVVMDNLGSHKGKAIRRAIRQARAHLLFLPPYSPDLKAKYQQLIAQGKPAKVAITAVVRKLIVTTNALLKADRLWTKSIA